MCLAQLIAIIQIDQKSNDIMPSQTYNLVAILVILLLVAVILYTHTWLLE